MPSQLVALTEGPDILLDKPILLLGRHQECDIQLNSRKISRRHCCIAQTNDQLIVRDLCSTNGIRINGVRVIEGYLKAGDQLTIGNFNYRLAGNAGPESAAAPAPAEQQPRKLQPPNEVFESCEMPVPLAEPAADFYSEPRPPGPAQQKKNPELPADAAPAPILPEQLDVAPLSEIFPKNNPPQHPSS